MLFREAVESFLYYLDSLNRSKETILCYKKGLKQLVEYIEARYNCIVYVEDVQLDDLIGFFEVLTLNNRLSESTRSRLLHTYKSFWNFAADIKGICSRNIAKLIDPIKVTTKEKAFLSSSEVDALFMAIINPVVKVVVQVLYYTGMRISECLNLEKCDIILSDGIGSLCIRKAKGAKERSLPILGKLYGILKEYEANCDRNSISKYYFHGIKSESMSAFYINMCIHHATANLGWSKHITAHVLRHSFASELVGKGVDLPTVQRILGHSNIKTTSIYCHMDSGKMSGALELLSLK